MKTISIALLSLLFAACGKESVTVTSHGINRVEDVKIQRIEIEERTYIELTITQEIDSHSPTYVTNLREDKWLNKLGYGLQTQIIGETSVISVFHLQPLVPMESITLDRDDFVWFPNSQYFPTINVETNEVEPVGVGQ